MTDDGQQHARLRDALSPDVTVPSNVHERMLAVIQAEYEHQAGQRDELAARRRRTSKGRWLVGAAAAVGLLMMLGVGMRGTLVNPPDVQGLPPTGALADESATSADIAADSAVAESAGLPGGSSKREPQQAKEGAVDASTLTLTAGNIVDQVRVLLSATGTAPQSQADIPAQCTAIVARSDAPTLTKPVDYEGTLGLLVVWRQADSYSIWVFAADCADVDSVLYHSLLPSSSAE